MRPKVLASANVVDRSPVTDEDLLNISKTSHVDMRDLISARVTLSELTESPPRGIGLDPATHRPLIDRAVRYSQSRNLPFWNVFSAVIKSLV